MKSQLSLLRDSNWDILIVLDACRWDYWNEMYGVGQPVRSPESCTRDWIRTIRDELEWSDVVGISGNPVVSAHSDFLKKFDDVGAVAHKKVNEVPTVPPGPITTALQSSAVLREERIYCHYIQPHAPYPFSNPPLAIHRARPEHKNAEIDIDGMPNELVRNIPMFVKESDEVTWQTVREGYRRNLEWVYDSVMDFAESATSSVVITSDHGEYLGEEGRFGHNCDYNSDIVRVVPWYEI